MCGKIENRESEERFMTTKFCGYDVHESADTFDMLDDSAFEKLKASIDKHGQLVPIVLYDGKILDGRNRAKACDQLGLRPKTTTLEEVESPAVWAYEINENRRHLTASQKAAAGVILKRKLEAETKARSRLNLKRGPELSTLTGRENRGESRKKAAEVVGVSEGYVHEAEKIMEDSPETFEQVRAGLKTLQQAKKDLYGGSKAHEGGKETKPAESDPEDKDPETLWSLKYHWRRAVKKEKTAFLKWVNAENTKPKAR